MSPRYQPGRKASSQARSARWFKSIHIADVIKTHQFNSREDMEQTLLRYVALYNHQLPQSALGSKTPMQAMKGW